MNKYAFLLGSLAIAAPSLASAEESTPKPSVCLSYQLTKSESGVVAICFDGKKPSLYSRFEVVEVPGKEAGRVKVLVGWR